MQYSQFRSHSKTTLLSRAAMAVLAASAFTASGMAHAEVISHTAFVLPESPPSGDWYLDNLAGGGQLSFSEDLIGALSTAKIVTSAVAPSGLTDDGEHLIVTAPLHSLTVARDTATNTFTADRVRVLGGASLATTVSNFATTGGSLSVTGITVDLTNKAIYADLTGGNGVGTVSQVHVWDYAKIDGPITFSANPGPVSTTNTLTGLSITKGAFDIFAQSLGLKKGGIGAMEAIADYGVMTATITSTVVAVPEPSTYAMMGVGLVGLMAAARRRQR